MKRKRIAEYDEARFNFSLSGTPLIEEKEMEILITILPNEMVWLIVDYCHLEEGFAFISTCSTFREALLNHHDLFIEIRLHRELNLLKRREESSRSIRCNKNQINLIKRRITIIEKVMEQKELLLETRKHYWTLFTNQYREPYKRAIWKYVMNRVRYYNPTNLSSTSSEIFETNNVNSNIDNIGKECSYFIDHVKIKCCSKSAPLNEGKFSLVCCYDDNQEIELMSEDRIPNTAAIQQFKEIIGINHERIGKNLCEMFSIHTILNILITVMPHVYCSTKLVEDDYQSEDDQSDESDQYETNLMAPYESSQEYFDNEADHELIN